VVSAESGVKPQAVAACRHPAAGRILPRWHQIPRTNLREFDPGVSGTLGTDRNRPL